MLIFMILGVCMFLSGILVFSMKAKHLLLMLLSLEFIVLSLYFLLFIYLSLSSDYFFSMLFLIFTVSEAALGLSILVSLIRTHGNDYFQTFNVLW